MTEQHPPRPPQPSRPDPGVTEYRQGPPPVPPPDPFRTHSAPKKKRHGLAWLIVGIVAVLGVGIASAGSGDDAAQLHNDAGVGTTTDHSATHTKPQKADVDLETTAQANARASAEDYLSTMPFSKKGLIHQLKFEGYSAADARYGVAAVHADWYEQAVKSAEDYLDTMPFSESDLVDQLEFEGFTSAQAEHGARVAYR